MGLMGITVRIPKRIHAAIKFLAMKDGRSVREYTRRLFIWKVEKEVEEGNLSKEYLEPEEETDGEG